jgi:eukaryotic-like serine/threonine-protein kinase
VNTCTGCHRLYPDDGGFCPIDGQRLLPLSEAARPSDPQDRRLGTVICGNRYQLWRTIADGGMGRVYEAVDLRHMRNVAVKILHADIAEDPVHCERFKREFECSASLPHDHIVEVFDFQRTEDNSYALVMEYLEGEELRMLLRREKVIAPERVIRMLSQVAIALAEAHRRKVVHRDLKPDNIFLVGHDGGDLVKVLDFGSVRDNSEGAKKLTAVGTTIGSPFYMSPEQAQALASLDHRADVWSLAAITYECLTGKLPFEGKNGPVILLAIISKHPVPPSVAGAAYQVPPTLDRVIDDALAKDPDDRIATIGELADRVGAAFGLQGSHRSWAQAPQSELGERIRQALPAMLARSEAGPPAQTLGAMDEAFAAGRHAPIQQPAGDAFPEDVAMGVPAALPGWVLPAIIGGVIVVFGLIGFLIAR